MGPFATNVRDAATMLERDRRARTRWTRPAPTGPWAITSARWRSRLQGLRIGVPAEYFGEGLDPEIRAAIEHALDGLRAAGCEVKTIALPHTKYAIPTYYVIATAEASANLSRFDGVRFGLRAAETRARRRSPRCTARRATRASARR